MIRYDPEKKQPLPVGDGPEVEPRIITYLKLQIERALEKDDIDRANQLNYAADDIKARGRMGLKKYGQTLRAHNGRNQLLDILEELYDGVQYGFAAALEGESIGGQVAIQLLELALIVRARLDEKFEGK